MKFLPGCDVMGEGSVNFAQAEGAEKSPLAKRLFALDSVTGVFLGSDFVTITKTPTEDWESIKPIILGALMDHFTSGDPVITEAASAAEAGEDTEITIQIKELLDTRVRPAVAQDGGDIVFEGYEDGIVYLHMQGSCAGCPSSTATLKHGIENMLRYYIPEIQEVRAVD
jgi:Fe-S cluster biogenesis protein NfuA